MEDDVMLDEIESERMKMKCEECILTRGCTRKTINIVDGYCWAEKLEKNDPGLTKEELARRHELID